MPKLPIYLHRLGQHGIAFGRMCGESRAMGLADGQHGNMRIVQKLVDVVGGIVRRRLSKIISRLCLAIKRSAFAHFKPFHVATMHASEDRRFSRGKLCPICIETHIRISARPPNAKRFGNEFLLPFPLLFELFFSSPVSSWALGHFLLWKKQKSEWITNDLSHSIQRTKRPQHNADGWIQLFYQLALESFDFVRAFVVFFLCPPLCMTIAPICI